MKKGELLHTDEYGKFHCDNGPAIEHSDGTKEWYFHGQRHRSNGPAIELPDGTTYWYWMNERHRVDGPAVESTAQAVAFGGEVYVEWWISGQKFQFNEYLAKIEDDDLKLMLTLRYGTCKHNPTTRMFLRSPKA